MPIWMIATNWLARLVLVLLIGLSIWSISIILERRRFFKEIEQNDDEANAAIESQDKEKLLKWGNANQSGLLEGLILQILRATSAEKIDRASSSYMIKQRARMEKGLVVLGTLGSTTPFVGLFGTVLGIIVAFGSLSIGQIDSKQVMFVLAEALVLTAAGLAVAIPAVIAFNIFNKKIKQLTQRCEQVKNYYLSQDFK